MSPLWLGLIPLTATKTLLAPHGSSPITSLVPIPSLAPALALSPLSRRRGSAPSRNASTRLPLAVSAPASPEVRSLAHHLRPRIGARDVFLVAAIAAVRPRGPMAAAPGALVSARVARRATAGVWSLVTHALAEAVGELVAWRWLRCAHSPPLAAVSCIRTGCVDGGGWARAGEAWHGRR